MVTAWRVRSVVYRSATAVNSRSMRTVQYMHSREYSTVLCSAAGRLRFMLAVHEGATRAQPLVTLWLFYVQ